jgi:predicted RecA/RadA family phage recombinase
VLHLASGDLLLQGAELGLAVASEPRGDRVVGSQSKVLKFVLTEGPAKRLEEEAAAAEEEELVVVEEGSRPHGAAAGLEQALSAWDSADVAERQEMVRQFAAQDCGARGAQGSAVRALRDEVPDRIFAVQFSKKYFLW